MRYGFRSQIRILQLIMCLLVATTGIYGQIKSSTITGIVTDSTGAVIPGATVTVVNEETNVASSVATDTTGGFTVPYLAPGTYRVTVEKANAGFSKAVRTGIQLTTAQTQLDRERSCAATEEANVW